MKVYKFKVIYLKAIIVMEIIIHYIFIQMDLMKEIIEKLEKILGRNTMKKK